MTFLNGALLFGAAAAAVPLILHILNRSRFRRVEWGAMHLLESVIRVNHKRFQFEQWLLLLVRCAIPVLLALCLARPVLTGSGSLAGNSPVSLVVLLDNSYSMDSESAGATRFETAVQAAIRIIEGTTQGSEISVIQTGGSPEALFDQPVFDSAAVVRRVRALQSGLGASDMQQALDRGLATLAGMSHARRELVVISDFQPADWAHLPDTATGIRQQLQALPVEAKLTMLSVGEQISGNLCVESLDFSARPLGVGQPLTVRASIRNDGSVARQDLRVVLKIDGQKFAESQINLPASAATQVVLPCEFAEPGSHVLQVEIDAQDALSVDDRLAAAVKVWGQLNVLLVDGAPASAALQGETDYLSVALTPYTFGRLQLADLVQTETITPDKLTAEQLANRRVVVMANVPQLKDDQISTLSNYVRDGGALLVCPGNRIDTKWYNSRLFAESGLLPAEFGLPRGRINEQGQSSRIMVQHFDHAALQFFNDASNGDLAAAEIRQWYQLLVPSQDSSLSFATPETGTHVPQLPMLLAGMHTHNEQLALKLRQPFNDQRTPLRNSASQTAEEFHQASFRLSDPAVIARLDNGDPFLVQQDFGDGVVLQMATSCDADWSDLPLRPCYVPLMQQLVATLATALTPPANIQTGEPAIVLLESDVTSESAVEASADRAADHAAATSVTLTAPDGTRRAVQAVPKGRQRVVRVEGTSRPGVYAVQTSDAKLVHFVATTSREESKPDLLQDSELQVLADRVTATVVKSPEDYLEQERLRRHGYEVWRYFLAALLCLMFLELVLQQRFSRVPR